MQQLLQKIETLLFKNSAWVFLTLFGFLSYILNEVYQSKSYVAYFQYFITLCTLFSPILIFSVFRNWLKRQLSPILFWGIWVICFLVYPWLIAHFGFTFDHLVSIKSREVDGEFASIFSNFLGSLVLLTELVILSNEIILKRIKSLGWVKKISLEKGILLTLFLLAILLAATNRYTGIANHQTYKIFDTTFLNNIFTFLYLSLQFSLAFLVYYFFYYANHYFLIPNLLRKKGIIFYGFGIAATILIFYPILGLLLSWMPIAQASGATPTLFENINQIMNYGSTPFIVMFLSIPIILVNQWFKQSAEIANLEKEKSTTELNLLKQQINPHFFFNTLNNLYALSITKDSQTPEVILQLSELMRYVIYKGKEETVTLQEEMNYIEDYVQLQKIRLHKKLDYRFEKNIVDPRLRVPPLLFIVLVENAFKHGIENSEEDCYLHLEIESTEEHLIFICKNSFEEKLETEGGIGLQNLKRRLALRFPDQHQFDISEGKNTFQVQLKINL